MPEESSATETPVVVDPAWPVTGPPADPPAPVTPPVTVVGPGRASAPVGWVIAAMLLFWPTGIPALLASHRAARAFGAGDVGVAVHESGQARRWSIVSVVVGGVGIILAVLSTIAWVAVVAVTVHDHQDRGVHLGPRFGNQQPFGGSDGRQHSNG